MDKKVESIPHVMVQEVMKISEVITEHKVQLLEAFAGNPMLKPLFEEITSCVTRALSSVDKVQLLQPSPVGSPSEADDTSVGKKRKISKVVEKRGGLPRRSSDSCWKVTMAKTLNDGQTWRKYGQKYILNAKNPRSYYRCTHKNDQGCNAIKHVQVSEEDNSTYIIKYYRKHTCKDPSKVPAHILPDKDSCLISFENIKEKSIIRPSPAVTLPVINTPQRSFTYRHHCTDEEVLSSNLTNNNSSSEHFMLPEDNDQQRLDEMLRTSADEGCVSSGFHEFAEFSPYYDQVELDNVFNFLKEIS